MVMYSSGTKLPISCKNFSFLFKQNPAPGQKHNLPGAGFFEFGSSALWQYIAGVRAAGKKRFIEFGSFASYQYIAFRKGTKPFGNGGAADAEGDACNRKALGR